MTSKIFILSNCLTTLNSYELVIDNTVGGKDNLAKKTREDADFWGICVIGDNSRVCL